MVEKGYCLILAAVLVGCETTPSRPSDPLAGQKVLKTITVRSPMTFRSGQYLGPPDSAGGIYHYKASSSLGDGGQSESQKAFLIFRGGSRARNIGITGAKGVEVYGDVRMSNIHGNPGNRENPWERMFSVNKGAHLTIDGMSARRWKDKVFNPKGGTTVVVRDGWFANGKYVYSDLWKIKSQGSGPVRTSPNRAEFNRIVAMRVRQLIKSNQRGNTGKIQDVWSDSPVLQVTNGAKVSGYSVGNIYRQ